MKTASRLFSPIFAAPARATELVQVRSALEQRTFAPVNAGERWLMLGCFLALASFGRSADLLTPESVEKQPFRLESLLPLAWQKQPTLTFNAVTEMTAAGRAQRVPTKDKPMFYVSTMGKFVQAGWQVAAGEQPPAATELEEAMRRALAANGYLPTTRPDQRPDVFIVFKFGSHGTDSAMTADDETLYPPVSAEELVPYVIRDVRLFVDVIERAALVGGAKFAMDLRSALVGEIRNARFNRSVARLPAGPYPFVPVSPDFDSPYQLFIRSGNRDLMSQLAEAAFHTNYFVMATAYDFAGVERKQKVPLWQTKMTVEAQGVSLGEVLLPMVSATAAHLGRETPEPVMVRKTMNRAGRVNVGAATVVEDAPPSAAPRPVPAR